MSHPSPALTAACLSAGLVSAWAPAALGDVQTQIDVSTSGLFGSVSHAVLLLAGVGSGSSGGGAAFTLPTLNPLSNLTMLSSRPLTDLGDSYAMIGLSFGTGSGGPGLVVSTSNLTYLSGLSFEQAFPGFTEAQLIDQLLTGGPGAEFFLRTNFAILLTPDSVDCYCTHFSNGSDFGTMNVSLSSVPAPTALALLPLGYLTQLRRRRA